MKRPIHVIPLGTVAGSHKASRDCRCGPRAHIDLTAGADPSTATVWVHRVPSPPPRFVAFGEDDDE